MYVDGSGNFVYEDPTHRVKNGTGGTSDHRTPQATFSNSMVQFDYALSARSVRNEIIVTGHQFVATQNSTIFSLKAHPEVPPKTPSGTRSFEGTLEILATFAHPVGSATIPAYFSQYKVDIRADGTGEGAVSGFVSVTGTVYGQAARLIITNTGTSAYFLTPGTAAGTGPDTLIMAGTELLDSPVRASTSDATSQTSYQQRTENLEHKFSGVMPYLNSEADYFLRRFKTAQPDNPQMTFIATSTALQSAAIAVHLSDRIRVTAGTLGITTLDYFVEKIHYAIGYGGIEHKITYTLSKIDGSLYSKGWLLGVAGQSNLGSSASGTTGLGIF